MPTSARHLPARTRRGFMFIELLIVMGMMGIISVIVIVAINPSKHLCETENGKRRNTEREMTNAINQYQVNTYEMAGGDQVPTGVMNARPICRLGVTAPTCVNLDVLVPDFLIALPTDAKEMSMDHTGYSIYRLAGGLDFVQADQLQDCGG
jgi:competence protein ComGC